MNLQLSNIEFVNARPRLRPHADWADRIVIVDGYSTGRDLVRELRDRGVECIHLQSEPAIPTDVRKCFDPSPYHQNLGYLGDAQAAAEKLAELAPDAVVAGSEWGVIFAESVAHGLGLPTNRNEMIHARRDKFEMIEAVRRHGLLVADQAVFSTVEDAHDWAEKRNKWPLVVKPLASAGSDGVTICQNHEDIDSAFKKALGRVNGMGGYNDRLLVQSFLSGPQYIVNTVSHTGRHYITDAWEMDLRSNPQLVIPGGITLMDPVSLRAQALFDYTLAVLDALGIENGAGHAELKWTPEGPALIEIGARLMGAAMDGESYEAAGQETQARVYSRVLAGTDAVRNAIFARPHYIRRRHMTKVLFNFEADATVRDTDGLARLSTLPSFHAHYRGLKQGDRVWKTADWLACGGIMYLIHDDPKVIAADIATIRQWEGSGALYGLEPKTTTP